MLAATISVPVEYSAMLPELIVLGGALVLLGAAATSRRPVPSWAGTWFSVGVGLASLGASLWLWFDVERRGPHDAVVHALAVDGFSAFVLTLLSGALVVGALSSEVFLAREGMAGAEYHVLGMLSVSGAMLMAEANDLIVIFLGLEIMSISLYVLAALNSRREESGEAAMKYFLLGAFSSAIFLYGIALTYGATGSTNLARVADFLASNVLVHNGVLLGGLALLVVGFGFKVAAVPFHAWTPDVYQGSPSPVTGFMAAVAKAGGFAGLLRVAFSAFPTLSSDWRPLAWALAALSLVVGAVLALVQRDIKRMLAYSSINHAGFVLVGLIGLKEATGNAVSGVSGSLYYLFAYAFMVLGSFAVVAVVARSGDAATDLEDYRGLMRRSPWLAGALTLLLLAQAGVPFTTGFLAKFYVVAAATEAGGAGSYVLASLAMVSAVVAAFFYLRVVFYMLGPPATEAAPAGASAGSGPSGALLLEAQAGGRPYRHSRALRTQVSVAVSVGLALATCSAVTVVFGVWPSPLLDFAHRATLLF
jgi:NADH-quinone oxidoreductase subunit N